MPNIFKAGIAKEINKAMGPLLFPLVLTKSRPSTRGDLTAGQNAVRTVFRGRGYTEDYESSRVDGTIIQKGDRKIVVLGASMSGEPKADDTLNAEGQDWTIIDVKRDPAGATYECQAR